MTPPKLSTGEASVNHIKRQIPPQAHTPMYNWHKYWARKTWNVVGEYIKAYCPEDGIVFDPFAGSGVSAIEALRNGRRAIVCDILPISTELIRLTIKPVDIKDMRDAFSRIEKKVKDKILSLYNTKCRKCGKEFPFTCAIWVGDTMREIRYDKCPYCGDRREKRTPPILYDKKLLKQIQSAKIKEWYPKDRLYYPNGEPFKEKQRYETLVDLFTKRNLQALAWLMEAVEGEPNKTLRDFLKIAFSSMVHLCTKMSPISEAGHFTPFSSAWTQHSYWYPSGPHMEQNVWWKFESSIIGHQGLIKGKEESNPIFKNVRFATDFREVIAKKADIYIHTGPCQDLMNKIAKEFPEGCADYTFTDPPYAASIQYGELAFLWVSWLKLNGKEYLETLLASEVVENKKQGKTFDTYESLLRGCMEGMYKVLKPDRYMTLTFHNPTFKVRNTTIRTGIFAGFDLQHTHHQELARASAKSLLQPFGSVQGDLYMRFYKPKHKVAFQEQADEERFEKIIIATAEGVIAERNEITPYAILVNAIDPQLTRNGFFRRLKDGLDVETVLKNHIGEEFRLVTAKLGGAEGKLWWFKDPSKHQLDIVPLSERVEQTVLRKLQGVGRVSFTEVWDAVSIEFPNLLTTDSTSIKEALQTYADPIKEGIWRIKPDFSEEKAKRAHSEMIEILAVSGKKNKFDIWIGRPEQGHSLPSGLGSGTLRQLATISSLKTIKGLSNPDTLELIDVLWLKGNSIRFAFEVEATTSMTEALNRCSNLDKNVPKYLVLPQSRESALGRKLHSPLFAERFKSDSWKPIYFEKIRQIFAKDKMVEPEDIVGKVVIRTVKGSTQRAEQSELF